MKRYPLFFVLLLASFGFLLPSARLSAQPSRAEFHLDLHFRDTVSGSIDSVTGRAFGYDPQASDGYDAVFGEDADYPGGNFFGGNDFWFERPYPDSATRVDIRHKPATDSFIITYSMGAAFEQYPGSIFWDPSQIPPIVKGIWISQYEATTPLVDLKDTNIFTYTNPSAFASNLVVTLFYNMQPRYISPAAVNGPLANGTGLLVNASAFPNPMPAGGALQVTLSDAASLSIVGYDVAGRELLRLTRTGRAGENILDLSQSLSNIHGAIMLHIDAGNGTRNETKNVMLVRE